ncbi:unnamed protein product [Owenia fusiformis]|uniref:Uncharacterized protein n=1 Tax=Owenia fusiformis TaxID=6347 RepID=A0A8J1TSF1_OWEFU|nr:unnamed protein product [Owenia fusiformis]
MMSTIVSSTFGLILLISISGVRSDHHTLPGGLEPWELAISEKLGEIEFNVTTRNDSAREHFMLGLKLLSCFWYDFAEKEFLIAQKIDPEMCLAYVGEALTKRMFLWNSDDIDAANVILANMTSACSVESLSQREQDYVTAVQSLFNITKKNDGMARTTSFGDQMQEIHEEYRDAQAGSLRVLAWIETAGSNETKLQKSREYIDEIFEANPNHPSVIHYALHAYDFSTPGVAIRGLPYAEKYGDVVSYASHGNHMPAHIYIRLGMWKESVFTEKIALDAGDDFTDKYENSSLLYDKWNRYHSLEYLQYYLLQQGRFNEAKVLMERMRRVISQAEVQGDALFWQHWYRMAARQYLETRNFNLPNTHAIDLETPNWKPLDATEFWSPHSEVGFHLARGLQAIQTKSSDSGTMIEGIFDRIRQIKFEMAPQDWPYLKKTVVFLTMQLNSTYEASQGRIEEAVEIMKEAVVVQESMVFSGSDPTLLYVSTWEFLGDMILKYKLEDHYDTAIEMYKKALLARPRRAASVYGLYKLYKRKRLDSEMNSQLEEIRKIWSDPDTDFEAREEIEKSDDGTSGQYSIHSSLNIFIVLLCALKLISLF